MLYLLLAEFSYYRTVEVLEKLSIDKELGVSDLHIHLKIELLALDCDHAKLVYRGQTSTDMKTLENLVKESTGGGGCLLTGELSVPKVEGLLEISPINPEAFNSGRNAAEWNELRSFNASHRIHLLSFGPQFPGQNNSLDGFEAVKTEGIFQFQYQLKIVPTTFVNIAGKHVDSSQYSSTYYFKPSVSDEFGQFGLLAPVQIPGVFWKFELSSITIEKQETRRSLLQFLTSVCAIVGGVYATGNLVSRLVSDTSLAKKLD